MKALKGKVVPALLLVLLVCGTAWGDVAYTAAAADYSSGSMGVLSGDAGSMTAETVLSNLGSDLLLFSFSNGSESRVLLDERNSSTGDRISIFKPNSWSAPIVNVAWSTTANAHGFAVANNRIYAAAYNNAGIVAYGMNESATRPYTATGHYYNCRADAANFLPHAERIVAVGSDLYALVNHADTSASAYMASELVKLNGNLDATASRYELVGIQHASDMLAMSNGSLAIAYRGGPQKAGTKGGIILIDPQDLASDNFEPTEIVGGEGGVDVGAVESMCSDGSGGLWFTAQEYQADAEGGWANPISKLYRWSGGNVSEVRDISATSGDSYQVKRDENDGTLAVLAGDRILILDSAGTLQQEFYSAELGGNPVSVAFFKPMVTNNTPAPSPNSGGSGGGGGGCSTAGGGALALLLPLFLIRRKDG